MTLPSTRPAEQLGQALARTAELVGRVQHGERGAPGLPGAPLLVPSKVYGEAALLLRAADGIRAVDGAWDALRLALGAALDDAGGLWRAVLAPAERWDHLFPLLLTPGGWSDAARELASSGDTDVLAAVPERLERAWLLAVAQGRRTATPAVNSLLGASRLADTDLLHGRLGAAYAFTHALLHGTDQGRWTVDLPERHEVAGAARGLLGAALLTDNDDAVAELLWTWPLLGLPLDPAAASLADRLAERFAARGFLPGPTYDAAVEADLPAGLRDTYRSQTSYHTTLAWGLTCAALLRSGHDSDPPSVEEPPTTVDPRPLLTGLPGRWATELAEAPPDLLSAVAPLVLAAAVRHAAATSDLARTRELLLWALGAGLEHEPVVGQAARWLREAATFADKLRMPHRASAPDPCGALVGATGIEPVTAGL